MTPVRPSCRKSTAAAPSRVASTRSNISASRRAARDQAPSRVPRRPSAPRSPPPAACRCRASRAARARTGRLGRRRTWRLDAFDGRALRDDDDAEAALLHALLGRAARPRSSVIGSSGMMIRSAPPPTPPAIASQPASRPITSTTMTRRCDSAVVCSRSSASPTIVDGGVEADAVVRARHVVVDRLRHADDGEAPLRKLRRDAERVVAADRHETVNAAAAQVVLDLPHLVVARARGWCATSRGSCRRDAGCPRHRRR